MKLLSKINLLHSIITASVVLLFFISDVWAFKSSFRHNTSEQNLKVDVQYLDKFNALDYSENILLNEKIWVPQVNSKNREYSIAQSIYDADVIYFELRPNEPAFSSDVQNGRSRSELAGFANKIENGTLVSRKFSIVFLEQDQDHKFQTFYQVYDANLNTAALTLETRNGGRYFNIGISADGVGEKNFSLSSNGFDVGKRYDFYIEFLLDDKNGRLYIEVNDEVAYVAYDVPIGSSGKSLAYDKFGIYRSPNNNEGKTRLVVYDFRVDDRATMDKYFRNSAEFSYKRGVLNLK